MDAFIECDARGCNARAYKETLTPEYLPLYWCNHHASQVVEDIPAEVRFQMEWCQLVGLRFTNKATPVPA